jgi:DNA-directed RNA polymerase specialized sigma subunit
MPGFTPAKVTGFSTPSDRLEPEYAPAYHAWKAHSGPGQAGDFLKAIDPIITQGVSVYGGRGANPMMRSRARRIALEAARKYDPARASLKTHLMTHLQGLRRYGAKQQQVLSVPEAVALNQHHLLESEAALRDMYGRDPSDAELADHTGLSRKRIRYIREYRPPLAEGQIEGAGQSDDEGGGGWEPAVEGPDTSRLRAEFLYPDLHPTDQVILEYGLGLNGSPVLPHSEIARRLNLSSGAVSQRAARIQRLLDQVEDTGVL